MPPTWNSTAHRLYQRNAPRDPPRPACAHTQQSRASAVSRATFAATPWRGETRLDAE
jgi:hypothetical protein